MKYPTFGLLLAVLVSSTAHAAGNSLNPVLDESWSFRLGATYLDAKGTFSSTIQGEPTDKLSTDDLNFGPITATGFLEVETSFKTDFYVAQVGYSFLKNERAELGLGGGLHVVSFDTALKVRGKINGKSGSEKSSESDLTVPLPNILGFGTYAFTPKLSLDGGIGWFGLDYDDYSGNLVAVNANLEYRFTDNFGVGVGYNFIDMDLEIEQSRRTDTYDLEYKGPVLYLSAGF